jgi:exodeoxyribonuclease V alpha subunit
VSRAVLEAGAVDALPADEVTVVGTLLRHRVTRNTWGTAQLHVEEASPGVNAGAELTVVGATVGAVAPGASLRVEGRLERHPRWGLQLQVERLENRGVRTGWAAANWLLRLDGVGRVLADRLVCRFPGDALLALLNSAPPAGEHDPLLEIQGISAPKAQAIRESWATVGQTLNPEDLRYLEGDCGLTRWEAQSVLALSARRGIEPRVLLEQDPYRLTELKGWGFPRADRVALKAGMHREAPARLEAAALYALRQVCGEQGHTALSQKALIRYTAELLAVDGQRLFEAIQVLVKKGLVMVSEEAGRRLVCDPDLYLAERQILRGVRRGRR